MPPRSRMAVDATSVDEPTAPETAVDETPEPVAEQPVAPASPVVTCVRVTEAFTASYGCQLLPFAADEIVHGDVAVFLSTAGVPVEPVDED